MAFDELRLKLSFASRFLSALHSHSELLQRSTISVLGVIPISHRICSCYSSFNCRPKSDTLPSCRLPTSTLIPEAATTISGGTSALLLQPVHTPLLDHLLAMSNTPHPATLTQAQIQFNITSLENAKRHVKHEAQQRLDLVASLVFPDHHSPFTSCILISKHRIKTTESTSTGYGKYRDSTMLSRR